MEITKVVKDSLEGVIQYFWQYSVYENAYFQFKTTSLKLKLNSLFLFTEALNEA